MLQHCCRNRENEFFFPPWNTGWNFLCILMKIVLNFLHSILQPWASNRPLGHVFGTDSALLSIICRMLQSLALWLVQPSPLLSNSSKVFLEYLPHLLRGTLTLCLSFIQSLPIHPRYGMCMCYNFLNELLSDANLGETNSYLCHWCYNGVHSGIGKRSSLASSS